MFFLELNLEIEECESQAESALSQVASDLKLVSTKSVKLENNGQIGYYFRVTLKDEKVLRNNRNYRTIDTNKNGVRFRNTAIEDVNEVYLKARREYEHQQQSVVKEIMGVAAGYIDSLQYLNDHLSILDVLTSFAVSTINAPIPYVRPQMLEKGTGSIELLQARHPCMELQDGVNFIPNDAVFKKGTNIFIYSLISRELLFGLIRRSSVLHYHGTEHGRQEHFFEISGSSGSHGAAGLFRTRSVGHHQHRRCYIGSCWRRGLPSKRGFHIYG